MNVCDSDMADNGDGNSVEIPSFIIRTNDGRDIKAAMAAPNTTFVWLTME